MGKRGWMGRWECGKGNGGGEWEYIYIYIQMLLYKMKTTTVHVKSRTICVEIGVLFLAGHAPQDCKLGIHYVTCSFSARASSRPRPRMCEAIHQMRHDYMGQDDAWPRPWIQNKGLILMFTETVTATAMETGRSRGEARPQPCKSGRMSLQKTIQWTPNTLHCQVTLIHHQI